MKENDQNSPFLGRKVLVYQRIDEKFTPKPPFPVIIIGDFKSRWVVKYQISDGTWIQKRILKGACSTKPIDKSIDASVFATESEKPKVQIRRRTATA